MFGSLEHLSRTVSQDTPVYRERVYVFGPYRVFAKQRQVLHNNEPLNIGSRAFDVLIILIEARGDLVDRKDLLDRVWPNTTVARHNVDVQISSLRRALGEHRGLIKTDAGRGYRFTHVVHVVEQDVIQTELSNRQAVDLSNWEVPDPINDLVGRNHDLHALADLMENGRLITIVGTGGVGKTQLAYEFARVNSSGFSGGRWLIDFDSTNTAAPEAGRTAFGHLTTSTLPALIQSLVSSPNRPLFILDHCDHDFDGAAWTAELLLRSIKSACVLACSHAPLDSQGEHVYRLGPLSLELHSRCCPPALMLFARRVAAANNRIEVDEQFLQKGLAICRELEGIPLAIELAASYAANAGLDALLQSSDYPFDVLVGGKRTAPPRHRTLRASLEWSFGLLTDAERKMLKMLSNGEEYFNLISATECAAPKGINRNTIPSLIVALVSKCLAIADLDKNRYRIHRHVRRYVIHA